MREFLKLIIPEKLEILLFLVLGFVLIVAINIKLFIDFISGSSSEVINASGFFEQMLTNRIVRLENLIDPRIIDFIVWTVIGIVFIGVILVIEASVSSAKDEERLVHYLNNPVSKAEEMKSYAIKFSIRTAAVLGLVAYFRLFLGHILPGLASAFFGAVTDIKKIDSIILLFLSPVLMALSLYAFAIFARLIALKPRVFGRA